MGLGLRGWVDLGILRKRQAFYTTASLRKNNMLYQRKRQAWPYTSKAMGLGLRGWQSDPKLIPQRPHSETNTWPN